MSVRETRIISKKESFYHSTVQTQVATTSRKLPPFFSDQFSNLSNAFPSQPLYLEPHVNDQLYSNSLPCSNEYKTFIM